MDLAKSYDLEGGKKLTLMPLWRYKNVVYNPKISWKEGVLGSETGSYTPATKTITIKQDAENFYFEKMGGVMEEMIHALQYKKYGANFTKLRIVKDFKIILKKVTNKGTQLPKTMNELAVPSSNETYWSMLVLFREKWAEWYGANHPYAVQHSQQKPDVLLFLTNQCNCSQRLIN